MFNEVYKLIEKSYLEHKATLDSDHLRDFQDVFIKQMNEAEKVIESGAATFPWFTHNLVTFL